MDIQSQVAARRDELARQARQATANQADADAQRKAAEQAQREAALDSIAGEISQPEAYVVRTGDRLELAPQHLSAFDIENFKQSKIDSLLKDEARKRWTAGENWLVIGSIIGGLCLIHLGGLGFVPLIFGLWRRSAINKKYRAAVRSEYPTIFGVLPAPA